MSRSIRPWPLPIDSRNWRNRQWVALPPHFTSPATLRRDCFPHLRGGRLCCASPEKLAGWVAAPRAAPDDGSTAHGKTIVKAGGLGDATPTWGRCLLNPRDGGRCRDPSMRGTQARAWVSFWHPRTAAQRLAMKFQREACPSTHCAIPPHSVLSNPGSGVGIARPKIKMIFGPCGWNSLDIAVIMWHNKKNA